MQTRGAPSSAPAAAAAEGEGDAPAPGAASEWAAAAAGAPKATRRPAGRSDSELPPPVWCVLKRCVARAIQRPQSRDAQQHGHQQRSAATHTRAPGAPLAPHRSAPSATHAPAARAARPIIERRCSAILLLLRSDAGAPLGAERAFMNVIDLCGDGWIAAPLVSCLSSRCYACQKLEHVQLYAMPFTLTVRSVERFRGSAAAPRARSRRSSAPAARGTRFATSHLLSSVAKTAPPRFFPIPPPCCFQTASAAAPSASRSVCSRC